MYISQNTLKKSLPIVATTIAEKFGVNIQLKGEDAYTDGKNIVLPAISETAIDGNVIYGYLLHECSHIRFSTFGLCSERHPKQARLHQFLVNILEDGRIENAISKEFAGAFSWLYELEKHILQKDNAMGSVSNMASEKKPLDLFIEWIYFFTRVEASGFKALYGSQFIETKRRVRDLFGDAFMKDVQGLLDDSLKAKSTQDLAVIADSLIDKLKQTQEDSQSQSSHSSGSSSNSEDQGGNQSADNNEANQSSCQNQGRNDASSDQDATSEGQESTSSSNTESDQSQSVNDQSAVKMNDVAEATSSILNYSDEEIEQLELKADPSKQIAQALTEEGKAPGNPHKLQTAIEPSKFLSGLNKSPYKGDLRTPENVVEDLLQEGAEIGRRVGRKLAAKIEAMARARRYHTERGHRLSSGRLASFVTGNTKVFTRELDAKKINTAVHIMIDMSSSMKDSSDVGAKKAAIAFAQSCGALKGVDVGVSTFNQVLSKKRPDQRRVQTLVKHGQGMCHLKEGIKNIAAFCPDGGTPSQDAVMAAQYQLSQVKNVNRRILMFITDGDVNSASALIRNMKKLGIETRGLFIDAFYLPGIFDQEVLAHSSMSSDEMAKCILDLMTDAVLN